MNLEHLKAMVWLRWMLTLRQWRRASALGAVVRVLVSIACVVAAVAGFGIALVLGIFLLPRADGSELLLVWDLVVVVFLFFWAVGVMTELQRSEPLSLTKLLHLPVSLGGAFLLNYAASWLCLSLVFWVPTMVGLTLASAVVFGPTSLVLLAPVVGLMLMVTALTHQLRGWLSALMADKRRRGTVLALVTIGFVLVVNIPGMVGLYFDRDEDDGQQQSAVAAPESDTTEEADEGLELVQMEQLRMANLALPPGWLPYASAAAREGRALPALLAALGTMAIAAASLALGYRTTLRIYKSDGSARRRRATDTPRKESSGVKAGRLDRLLQWRIPGCPEQATAVATASFRILVRAPHTKMVLMTPLVLIFVFGGLLLRGGVDSIPKALVPLLGFAAIGLTMLSMSQLIQNLFGYDRDGFRVFVLSSAPRSEILLGKNLAMAPLALGMGVLSLVVLQVLVPLRPTHLAATFLQLVSIYVVCCMVGNLSSVLAPMAMSSGTMQAARPGGITVVKQLTFALLIPVVASPTTIPLGLEMAADVLELGSGVPIYLLLSLVEVPLVLWIYHHVLAAEGKLLALRERRVLEVVTAPE